MTDYLGWSLAWSALWFTSGVGVGYLLRILHIRYRGRHDNT